MPGMLQLSLCSALTYCAIRQVHAAGVCSLSGPMVYPSAAVVKVNAGFELPESESYVSASLYRTSTAIGEDTFLACLVVVQNHSE